MMSWGVESEIPYVSYCKPIINCYMNKRGLWSLSPFLSPPSNKLDVCKYKFLGFIYFFHIASIFLSHLIRLWAQGG